MKKTYIIPTIDVIKVNMQLQMLAGSLAIASGDKDPATEADGHDDDFDW